MPELPEVETIRRGLEPYVTGQQIVGVEILRERATRRQPGGTSEFLARVQGRTILGTGRRGKFLWLELDDASAITIHLGMSGQLIVPNARERNAHTRAVFTLADPRKAASRSTVLFNDQRTFGWLWASELVDGVPVPVHHIALDLMDPAVEVLPLAHKIHKRHAGIKRVLLNQEIVSGIGNIYADEMLWATMINGETAASNLSIRKLALLIRNGRAVMSRAIDAGGTSFDELYVSVNGNSGYFSRQLNAYGQAGKPCPRCRTPIIRRQFMNRSSYFCPKCQRLHLPV